jgi:transcriptional regulator with XRE-family HTH domain
VNSEERRERLQAKQRRARALGARLRALRGFRGYSQTALARRSGVARQLVSMLEQGRRLRPEPATLEKLAAGLDVTVDQLRGRAPVPGLNAAEDGEDGEDGEAPPAGTALPVPDGGDYVTSLGLLPALPPGTTIIQRRNPDGSTEVYLHIPGPCNEDNPDATDGG